LSTTHEIVAGETDADLRLDLLIAGRAGLSRTQAATLIAGGHATVNGRPERASYRARVGDRVVVDVPPPPGRDVVGESIPLTIVYEDDALLVVDKPAGMVVHPAPGHWQGTLVNALVGRQTAGRPETGGQEAAPTGSGGDVGPVVGAAFMPPAVPAVERAGLVHRLDKDTSGLVMVAKTDRAHRLLTAAVAARRVRRVYAALAWGHLEADRLTVDAPIGRDPRDRKRMAIVNTGRSARTDFVRLARFDSTDLLRARLHTGRTHQIRVHLASVGHPVVGDDTYGGGGGRRLLGLAPRRHFLHAAWLTLDHPITGAKLDLRSRLPADLHAAAMAALAAAGVSTEQRDGDDFLEHVGFYQRDD
jgi:23S rRNA pseudouridine1911/1915/1917 synthase